MRDGRPERRLPAIHLFSSFFHSFDARLISIASPEYYFRLARRIYRFTADDFEANALD